MLNARTIETLLPLLEMVWHRHSGQWSALCPADADRGPNRASQLVLHGIDAWHHAVGVERAKFESMECILGNWKSSISQQDSKFSGSATHGE